MTSLENWLGVSKKELEKPTHHALIVICINIVKVVSNLSNLIFLVVTISVNTNAVWYKPYLNVLFFVSLTEFFGISICFSNICTLTS